MKKVFMILMMLSTLLSAIEMDTSNIKVNEFKYFTKGFRMLINASIKDQKGIYEARTYFKHSMVENYQVFSPMTCLGNKCSAELPLTDISLKELNFMVVYQSSNGEIFKSEVYTVEKRDMLVLPSWQTLNTKDIHLLTDYAKPMKSIRGFKDRFDIKKSTGDALGVEAGLYTMKTINPKVKIDCSSCVGQKNNTDIFKIKD